MRALFFLVIHAPHITIIYRSANRRMALAQSRTEILLLQIRPMPRLSAPKQVLPCTLFQNNPISRKWYVYMTFPNFPWRAIYLSIWAYQAENAWYISMNWQIWLFSSGLAFILEVLFSLKVGSGLVYWDRRRMIEACFKTCFRRFGTWGLNVSGGHFSLLFWFYPCYRRTWCVRRMTM